MGDSLKPCPHCAEFVMPEAIVCRFCDRGISNASFKNCPHCSEMVWTSATYCRYCKSTLGAESGWGKPPDRKRIFDEIKAGTGIHLDDAAIDKIFETLIRRRD